VWWEDSAGERELHSGEDNDAPKEGRYRSNGVEKGLHGDLRTSAHDNESSLEEATRNEVGIGDGGDNDATGFLVLRKVAHTDRSRPGDLVWETHDGEVSSQNLVPRHVEA